MKPKEGEFVYFASNVSYESRSGSWLSYNVCEAEFKIVATKSRVGKLMYRHFSSSFQLGSRAGMKNQR